MLRKMRRRFIGVAMAAFTTVVLALLLVINIWNYSSITRQQDEILRSLASHETTSPPPPAKNFQTPGALGHFSPEVQYMIRFFTVCTDENGNPTAVNQDFIASISQAEAVEYARQVLQKGSASGYFEKYRYLRESTESGSVIVFLNSEKELRAIHSLLAATAAVAVCCLLMVFLLIVALSNRAVAPYARNMESQKRFITDAGHELKTPLTAISTSADVLAMENESNEWVQNIQLQAGRMAKLIADLITLSRLDEAQPFPNKAVFSLTDAAWELSEPFSILAEAAHKEYIQHIEDNIQIFGDKTAIQQVISLLLDNAVKYTNQNGKIRLDVIRRKKGAEILVYNTCRIENYKNINRIFERFYRLDEAHNASDSYGVGLSIAKAVIENHGGTICAESEYGNNLLIRIKL